MLLKSSLIIGTRGSALALWQAEHVKRLILREHPDLEVKFEIIVTKGDKIIDSPLSKIGGKGLFISEIEDALLEGRVDVAVHSLKDMPMLLPAGLALGCILERGPVADAFLSCHFEGIAQLPKGANVGSSSLRRAAQLKAKRPDLNILPLRGNIDTRVKKLERGEYDAIILAQAGMERLGLKTPFMQPLDPSDFVPAAGQGALAVEFLEDRTDLRELFKPMEHGETRFCIEAERSFVKALDGGCHSPIAAWGEVVKGENGLREMSLTGFIATTAGDSCLALHYSCPMGDFAAAALAMGTAVQAGLLLAARMKKEGQDILRCIIS